jgi:hypothetical protein
MLRKILIAGGVLIAVVVVDHWVTMLSKPSVTEYQSSTVYTPTYTPTYTPPPMPSLTKCPLGTLSMGDGWCYR